LSLEGEVAVRRHDGRHLSSGTLLQEGVDMRYVQTVLGHSSIATTELYGHLAQNFLQPVHKALIRTAMRGVTVHVV
jgi:integrase/recombinase XerC